MLQQQTACRRQRKPAVLIASDQEHDAQGQLHRVGLTVQGKLVFFSHSAEEVANTRAAMMLGAKPECLCFRTLQAMSRGKNDKYTSDPGLGPIPVSFWRAPEWRLWRRYRARQMTYHNPAKVQLEGTEAAIRKYGRYDVLRAVADLPPILIAGKHLRLSAKQRGYLMHGDGGVLTVMKSGLCRTGVYGSLTGVYASYRLFDTVTEVQQVVCAAHRLAELSVLQHIMLRATEASRKRRRIRQEYEARLLHAKLRAVGVKEPYGNGLQCHETIDHEGHSCKHTVTLQLVQIPPAYVQRLMQVIRQNLSAWQLLTRSGPYAKKDDRSR